MGILSWLRSTSDKSDSSAKTNLQIKVEIDDGTTGLVKLTGTTTFSRDSIHALLSRRGVGETGYLQETAALVREPDNAADPMAVAVQVEGERVGYLPSYVASSLDTIDKGSMIAPVQIFSATGAKGIRAEAFVWLGPGDPQWQYDSANRPPLLPEEKRAADHARTTDMVADAIAGGGDRAKEFQAGMVGGIHYLQTIEPIKELKRQGRLEEALQLCYVGIEGAEGHRWGGSPAPWYTEQAAIVHRKLGQRAEEIAVLRRWLAYVDEARRSQTSIGQRLSKLEN